MPAPAVTPRQSFTQELAFPAGSVATRWSNRSDRLLLWLLRLCAGLAGILTLLIFTYLCAQSVPLLRKVGFLRLFTDQTWAPASGHFTLVPMLLGTCYAALGAISVATPLSIALAIFVTFYAPPSLAGILRGILGLLAGLPSVVYGLWGLVALAPLLNHVHPPGLSLLLGIVILTIMTFPTIALVAEAALRAVPQEYVLGGFALGCARWRVVRRVVLPAARSGLGTVLLGTTRALGETMAVLMVMGNTIQIPANILAPTRTLTGHIALEMAYALGDHRAALFTAGVLLLGVVTGLVLLADRVSRSQGYEI